MEQLQNVFTILSTIVFLYLGIIWSTTDLKNINIKVVLIVLCITGIILTLANLGYIMKV